MAQALRRLSRKRVRGTGSFPARLAAALLALVFVPLLWSLGHAAVAAWDAAAWRALWHDGQTLPALRLSLWSALASTALASLASAWLLSMHRGQRALQRLLRHQGWLLAVPHVAFALGLVLWMAPSGWLLRALSPWATGLQAPPAWPTTQDPWALGLIAVLAFKETPFILWAAGTHLLRPDVALRLQRELQLAASFGYGPRTAWWRVVWPKLLPRIAAPLLAVWAYGLTVVDVALVIGPTTPPTLAVLCWQWLQDASDPVNAKGAAAAWALAATVGAGALVAWGVQRAPFWRQRRVRGMPASHAQGPVDLAGARITLPAVYIAVLAALFLGSLIGVWPFPDLWPTHWSLAAWHTVRDSAGTVWATAWLAAASAGSALLWVVAWLEWAPRHWQRHVHSLVYAPLLLPALLWVIGLHRLALAWGLDATAAGVWLAHTLACLPYVLLTTVGAYGSFDARCWSLAASLGQTRRAFLLRVKWPMLRATLAGGFAVGFAVSVAQYLPTLYVGAGRINTITTEAVALAAGGQRSLMAAFAWLQWLLPALVFALAARLGQTRRLARSTPALGTIRA